MSSVPVVAIAVIPATILVMGQVVQSVSQASEALARDPADVAMRLKKAEWIIGGSLILASLTTGDTATMLTTFLAVAGTYLVFDRLVLS